MFKAGVFFYALFGVGWWMFGISHFGGRVVAVGLPFSLLIGLGLMLTAKRRLPDAVDGSLSARHRQRFAQVNAVQWILIAAVAVACGSTGRPGLIPPLVALIVGAHFFPLATVFDQPRLRVPGALLIAVGFAGLAVWAVHGSLSAVSTIVGVACALTLWGTGAWTIISGGSEGGAS